MVVNLSVAEQMEEALDFFVTDRTAQANIVDVDNWHQHRGLVRQDAEVEKSARRTQNRFLFNFLYNAQAVVRVNDLVANVK
jgi:hypothetical protein